MLYRICRSRYIACPTLDHAARPMPIRHNTLEDKNFDGLAHHFKRNVYGHLKGAIRLAVIERDLAPYLHAPLNIIDAGGGQGQFAIALAKRGNSLTLCDISAEMLAIAREDADQNNVADIRFVHCSLQSLAEQIKDPADMIMCHAVLEWMASPEDAFPALHASLKSGGILSLAFFNVNSIIYKNLLRANYRKAVSNEFVGMEGSLTPINPLKIDQVFDWCKRYGFEIITHSGIRVFHDYISDQTTRNRHPEAVVEMELKFSQQEPFRSLGRYIHIVAKKL